MLTILHGENIVKSRQALYLLKEKYASQEIVELPLTTDLTLFKQALEAQSLFYSKRLVVIENLLTSQGKRKKNPVIEYLGTGEFTASVILWEERKIDQRILSRFGIASIKLFKLEPILFRFLDSISPGNGQQMIKLFHQTLKSEAVELIFFMLVRQLRLLLAIQTSANIPEIVKLASWQRQKLLVQARSFEVQQMTDLLKRLFTIEYNQRQAGSGLTLVEELDILLATL